MDWLPEEAVMNNVLEVLEDSFVPDNQIQKSVQEKLCFLQRNPDFCNYLLLVCENSQQFDDKTRALSGLILKNNIVYVYDNIPPYVKQNMQRRCLNMLEDSSKELRLSASVLVNVMIQKEGIANASTILPYVLNLMTTTTNRDVCLSAMKTLVHITEDYLAMHVINNHLDVQIKDLLGKFIDLIDHGYVEIRKWALHVLNDSLQKHYQVISGEFDTGGYLDKLMAHAHDEHVDVILAVLQGFVVYIQNRDEHILPALNEIIMYMLMRTRSLDMEIALQASEFWFSLSKLPTCVSILRGHLKTLLPVLLINMKYSDNELLLLKDTLGKDLDKQDRLEDVKPFAKTNEDDEVSDIGWTLRKCSAASLDSLALQYDYELAEIVVPLLIKHLESDDILLKESAILALGAISEGCFNSILKLLPDLIAVLLQCMQHQYSLIRSITCWTLSRYTRFIVYDDKLFVATMMVLLEHSLDENKRVQRAAISSFCFFQEEAQNKLVPYIDIITQAFMRGFNVYKTRSLYLLYDAIGVLAHGVGSHFTGTGLSVLMPLLLSRFNALDEYANPEEFLAICDCLSSVVTAAGEDFAAYAHIVFVKCSGIIAENNNSSDDEESEFHKNLVSGAIELMVALAGSLKAQFVSFVTNTNLIDLLYATIQDKADQVRQPGLALLGELIRHCFPYVSHHVSTFMPLIIENLDKRFNGACNNAAWVIGKLCIALDTAITPYVGKIIEHAVEILQGTDTMQAMYKTVAITFCMLALVCPNEVATCLKSVMRPLCTTLRNVLDCEEKELAFKGLCELVVRNPEAFATDFIYFCDAVASWNAVDNELMDKIRFMILEYRKHVGDDNWEKIYGQFPPMLKNRMAMLYGVQCPKNLISPLIKIVIDEVRKNCKKDPIASGYNSVENAYEPLRLMQSVILQVNEICLRYLDNSMLCSLPSPGPPYNLVSYHAIRNTRRRMEDRHVIVHDLNTIFNNNEASPSSYYAIFDGHAGHDAAAYGAAHLHQYLAESKYFASNPENALIDAFCKTDLLFLEKCKVENFSGGTTAVCALLRPKEKCLYIAWVGDSQAVLTNQGVVEQCVNPHKPNRPDERKRIESQGGSVVYWGAWRVNGQLAVSRAIGDSDYKPHITAEPEVREYQLEGTEDFLVIACDGLWDVMGEMDVAVIVYNSIYANPETVADTIAHRLVQISKEKGSTDNISVIVVFLREPTKIAAEPHWEIRAIITGDNTMEAGFDNANAPTSNPFANTNGGAEILAAHQKDGFQLSFDGFHHSNAVSNPPGVGVGGGGVGGGGFFTSTNGKNDFDMDDLDDDMGPETDVDALDDVQSPVKLGSSIGSMSEELEEKVAKEIDANLMKSVAQHCNVDSNLEHDEDDELELELDERKEEAMTSPADEVHDAGLDSDSEEDEWKYTKGDAEEDKENVDPTETHNLVEPELESAPQAVGESEEIDNMSQLNPNAEEFVPISPTRTMDQPMCAALKEEQILAQSPRRPNANYDFNLPDEEEFNEDVKNRPSNVYNSNGHENGHKQQSSQEIMENLLNGKNLDDIDFQPIESPTLTTTGTEMESPSKVSAASGNEEFLFGPNAAAFSTPSKYMDQSRTSTKANFGDESVLDVSESVTLESNNPFAEDDLLSRLNKDDDPMSMSFYQDKDDDANPFDLNKVQELPNEEEQDDVLAKAFNDTISDLPEHEPLRNDVVTTDLDTREDDLFGVHELPKSPVLKFSPDPVPDPVLHSDMEAVIPEPAESFAQRCADLLESPILEAAHIVEDSSDKIFVTDDEIIERPQEPLVEVGAVSPMPDCIAEEPEIDDFPPSEGSMLEPDMVAHPEPVVCYASREAEFQHQEAASEDVSVSSDIHQQEFILETSHEEMAQSPQNVVIEQTPEQELIPVIPDPVYTESAPAPEPDAVLCPMPPKEDVEVVLETEVPVEQPPPEPELVVESPILEKAQDFELLVNEEKAHLEEIIDLISPCREEEEPIILECSLPLEFTEVLTPVDDNITSSIKDDSPMDEIKEIQHELIDIAPEPAAIIEEAQLPVIGAEKITEEIVEPVLTEVHQQQEQQEISQLVNNDSLVSKEESSLTETIAGVAAVAAAATTVAVGAGVVAEAKKPTAKTRTSATSPTKKPTTKTTAKPLASKPLASKTASAASKTTSLTSKPMAPKTTTAKPSTARSTAAAPTATKAPARPRAPLSATAAKPAADKKPLTNGDAKPPAPKIPPIKRPQVPSTTMKPAVPKTTSATTKPATTLSKPTSATARPAATSTLKTTTTRPVGTVAPKPRPTTLATTARTTTKTTTTARPLSSSTTTTTTRTVTMKSSVGSAPKPKPASAPLSKPRVPLSARTTTAKAPDTEKQNKENVNKLTASRTATTRTTTRKVDTTKTAPITKTSTMSKTTAIKRPAPKTAKPIEEEVVPNGMGAGEKEMMNDVSTNEADLLLKDLSPVNNMIIDNSQLAEATAD